MKVVILGDTEFSKFENGASINVAVDLYTRKGDLVPTMIYVINRHNTTENLATITKTTFKITETQKHFTELMLRKSTKGEKTVMVKALAAFL